MARTHEAHLSPSERAKRRRERDKARKRQEMKGKSMKQVRGNERARIKSTYL